MAARLDQEVDWREGIINGNQYIPIVTSYRYHTTDASVRFLPSAAIVRVRARNEVRFMARLLYCLGAVFVKHSFGGSTSTGSVKRLLK